MSPANPAPSEATRDVIVVGASLGGIKALVGGLPAAVVQHVTPCSPGTLAEILRRRVWGRLRGFGWALLDSNQ